jgi:hypothetical protein
MGALFYFEVIMFYCEKLQTIDTNSSYLHPQQVFAGNYWDDFGLTPFLVPDGARVLMLGLSLGGGIRPLLSSTKNISLTCVDFDQRNVERCRTLFAKSFPHLGFETMVADAWEFIESTKESYDLIWLDIYEPDSYSELCFDADFLKNLREKLTSSGVLAVNAYGIPSQFKPLQKASAQRALAYHLQNTFSFVGNLPFRRNQTLLAANTRPLFYPAQAHSDLSGLDKKSLAAQGQRLRSLQALEPLKETTTDLASESQFVEIDHHMLNGWQEILKRLSEYGVTLSAPRELLGFIQNGELCSPILVQSMLRKDDFISFVAILCAGESHIQNLDVSWIFSWTVKYHHMMAKTFPEMYRQVWLPQLWALILHPDRKYRSFSFQISNLIQETP